MASIVNDPGGRRRIQFVSADRKRRTIYLGRMSMRSAEAIKRHVEELNSSITAGVSPSVDTGRWLKQVEKAIHDKLVLVGLVQRREDASLAGFTQSYLSSRVDIKPRTRTNLDAARSYLLSIFGGDKPLRSFTEGDAESFRLELIRSGKAESTVRRAIGRARQYFKAAMSRGLIDVNPFAGMSATVHPNTERYEFVSRETIDRVLEKCPDREWRLIIALARYGGLRCPSEVIKVRWSDLDWDRGTILVHSPKTEHLLDGRTRILPMFPELRKELTDCFDGAEDNATYVITRYRCSSSNLRTQFTRIIKRAGVQPWPKIFQNLRSTRQTELMDEFPIQAVCGWLGNNPQTALRHYLQTTRHHIEKANRWTAQNTAQSVHETPRLCETAPT